MDDLNTEIESLRDQTELLSDENCFKQEISHSTKSDSGDCTDIKNDVDDVVKVEVDVDAEWMESNRKLSEIDKSDSAEESEVTAPYDFRRKGEYSGYRRNAALLQPTTDSVEDQKFTCEFCDEKFDKKGELKIHLRVTDCAFLLCKICYKQFSTKYGYIRHIRNHTGVRRFACDHCSKSYHEKKQLKIHMRIHSGQKFGCEFCTKEFLDEDALNIHIKRLHTKERPYLCQECGKTFADKCVLRKHLRIHTGVKPYKCDQCSRAFFQRGNLLQHIDQSHSVGNFYMCEYCGKTFKTKPYLTSHQAIHIEGRPFNCQECGQCFSTKRTLDGHIRGVHREVQKVECIVCNRSFNKKYIKIHMRTHTGEKPHKCPHCGEGFAKLTTLKTHIYTHTGERPYICKECGKDFNQKSSLNRHMQLHR